jgi:hypothetical protein
MDKTIRNIALAAIFLFSASFDSCYYGTRYDEHYKLFPECGWTCTGCIDVYGGRWERLGAVLCASGIGFSFAFILIYRRKQQAEHFHKLTIYKR